MDLLKYKLYLAVLFVFILVLLAWSPWITKDYAESRAVEEFNREWYQVQDGCGFNCQNCGIYKSEKTFFGYDVTILYSCGFKDYPPTGSPDWQDKIFVSPFGTVHTISHESNLD